MSVKEITMKLLRIINKDGLFLRDDFTFDENEIGLDVEASQGFYQPKWNGTEWVEGATEIPTPQPTPQEPTIEERLHKLEEENAELKSRLMTVESIDAVQAELLKEATVVKGR